VVLTKAFNPDVLQKNHFIVACDLFEGALEIGNGIIVVTGKPFFIGASDPGGGVLEAFTGYVIAGPFEEGANCVFGFFTTWSFRRGVFVVYAVKIGQGLVFLSCSGANIERATSMDRIFLRAFCNGSRQLT
jgi:hypothetical protein